MRILLTNDDGIFAPGIQAARAALETLGEVYMVAPERPRSAAGHAITLHKPLRITGVTLSSGKKGFATNGTPTDCVTLGWDIVMERRCDLVVSGINAGPNLGWDLTYSGTVSAAMEGAVLNIPSIAISVASEGIAAEEIDFSAAAAFLPELARHLLTDPLPPHHLLNVNVPSVPASAIRGVHVTHQGRREYVDRVIMRHDPSGRPYYWQAGSIREDTPDPGSDVHAILENAISVTPVALDLTAYPVLEQLRNWQLGEISP
jgi:5'-nucleotidase